MYLVHLTVLASLASAVFLATHERLGQVGAAGLAFGVSVPVVFVLAELMTRFIDEPAIRLSGTIYRRMFRGGTGRSSGETASAPEPLQPAADIVAKPSGVTEPSVSAKIAT